MSTEKEEKDESEVSEVEKPEKEEPEVKDQESDPIEEFAKELGWIPKEDFDDSDGTKEFVDAKTFIKKEREIGKRQHEIILKQNEEQKELRRQIREIKNTVVYLKEHQNKVTQAQIDKIREELAEAKREAIVAGDVEKVEQIEKQLDKVAKDYTTEVDTLTATREPDQDYLIWRSKNDWYEKDEYLTYIADKVSKEKASTVNTMKELLDLVDNAVAKAKISKEEKINNPVKHSTVVGADKTAGRKSSKKFTAANLSYEQKKVAENFVKTGIFKTEQDYVDELVKSGVLE